MKYPFKVYQMIVDDHIFWVAQSQSLKGCVGQGDTAEDALNELSINESEWLDTAQRYGIAIPEVPITGENAYSGKVSLRFSPIEHEKAAENAKMLGISLNQYLSDAVSFYNGAFDKRPSATVPVSSTSVATSMKTTIDTAYRSNILNFNIPQNVKEN